MDKRGKVRTNAEVAAVFDEIADILELKGDNPFKIRAYRNAARVIESLTQDVSELARRGELTRIPGIGAAISKKIDEILRTGRLRLHEELKKSVPEGLLELLKIPGLGAKTVSKIHERFGVSSVEELERLARERRLRKLPGLGPKAEERILRGIEQYKRQRGKILLWRALPLAERLLEEFKRSGFEKVAVAGDVRRMKDVVRRIDILVAGEPDAALRTFAELEGIESPSVGGRSASAIVSGVPVRLEVAPPEAFGAALLMLTGSEAHVSVLKTLAAE
ncbi:MAG: helix-hairpin-helix domain-containing protein, partial [Candidatus Alkanophagales archaeon]